MISNRLWLALCCLIMAVVLGGGWFVGVAPQLSAAHKAEDDREGVEAQNSILRSSLVSLEADFANLGQYTADRDELRRQIPLDDGVGELLDELDGLAAANGVVIESFTAAAPAPFVVVPERPVETTVDMARLFTIAVDVEVSGTQEQVLAFTKALQLGERLVLVSDFSLTADTENPALTSARLSGPIYVLVDAADVAPAETVETPVE